LHVQIGLGLLFLLGQLLLRDDLQGGRFFERLSGLVVVLLFDEWVLAVVGVRVCLNIVVIACHALVSALGGIVL
jgi:hypothetical protein